MTDEVNRTRSPVYLVGFMGCGKTAVGRELAVNLGREFVDLDREVEIRCGASIADLINAAGETTFRRVEREALIAVSSREAVVVATGGGVVLDPANRRLMRESGITVWLDAPFELCWNRITADGAIRPLAPDRQSALARYTDRLEYYRESELRVEVTEPDEPCRIARTIAMLLDEITSSHE